MAQHAATQPPDGATERTDRDPAPAVSRALRILTSLAEAEAARDEALAQVPNPPDDSAPDGFAEEDAEVLRVVGEPVPPAEAKEHTEIGRFDMERAARLSGSRFGYLIGDTALLALALYRFALDTAVKHGHTPMLPPVLERLPIDAVTCYFEPDGTFPNHEPNPLLPENREFIVAKTLEARADLGVAYDGDADRCLAVDHAGEVVDGDQLLAVLALALRDAGRLKADTVVATVMSNLGFVQAMRREKVGVRQTKVDDRYVLEAMKAHGHTLGGEQSGHVIMSEHATTGDGVLTALHLASRMARTGRSLAELASVMNRLPQVLVNVSGVDKARAGTDAGLLAAVAEADTLNAERPKIRANVVGHDLLIETCVRL